MKFQVYATSTSYHEDTMDKYWNTLCKYNGEKGPINKATGNPIYEVDIKSLEELIKMINELDEEVIVYDGVLEIYDDYRE